MHSRCIWQDDQLEVHQIPVLQDNYVYVLHERSQALTAVVDPSVVSEVDAFLRSRGWRLDFIFNTHHHGDHIGGNRGLQELYGAKVMASDYDSFRIDTISQHLKDGDCVAFGDLTLEVLTTPGHTLGHIVYRIREKPLLFCGDTLFALGCGRLFEGSPDEMWSSLKRIEALSEETLICCAHEYTLANARFVKSLDESPTGFDSYVHSLEKKRAEGLPTVPTRLRDELLWNPFLRRTTAAEFARIRRAKDEFRG